MSVTYWRNNFGLKVTDDEMASIDNPKTELTIHVTLRVTQVLMGISTCILAPIAALSKKDTRNVTGLLKRVRQFGVVSAGVGIVVGNILIYNFMKPLTEDQIYDRVYRIRKNKGQVNVDRALVLGTTGGVALGAATTGGAALGGVTGMMGSIFAVTAFNAAYTNRANK